MTAYALAYDPVPQRDVRLAAIPRSVGAAAVRALGARGDPERIKRVLSRTFVPIIIVDGQRRYIEANPPARLAFRVSLAELRRLRIDDLTPPYLFSVMEAAWARLIDTGSVVGPYEVASPDGGRLSVTYYGLANALPGLHLIAFAPAGWPDCELAGELHKRDGEVITPLTPRELEVLELAAEGLNGPAIARVLVVSPATVSTHFEHIYEKLGVTDRAGAVAKAMRLGLIA
jgi:DNA-binding CsgD family transcriptional regulator